MKKKPLIIIFYIFIMSTCLFGSTSKKKRILFVINPLSHEIKNFDVKKSIEDNLDHNQFEYKIVYTEFIHHATYLAENALANTDIIAAVGGDGTVNEIGRALVNTKRVLAIIPIGSGNGLARHLGIPIGLIKAIKSLNRSYTIVIDTAKINDKIFLGTAGIGFDAQIAHKFAQFGKRGFFSYCRIARREFSLYKPKFYSITIDGKKMIRKAFILTFANSSQYGNNFTIAPKAEVSDGSLDLVIIDDIPRYSIPQLVYSFKYKTLDRSNHFETYRFKELIIHYPHIQGHVDGEPVFFQDEIKVTIQPESLKVLIPK